MGTRTRFMPKSKSIVELEQIIATGPGKQKLRAQNELAKRQKLAK